MMFIAALVYILPAIWGIITSVGLFRLREWARISIIVFSVLLFLMSAFGGLMFLVVPIPPSSNQAANANVAAGVRIFMTVFAGTMMSVGIWWLVFFTRPRVRQQFVPLRPGVVGGPGVETLPEDPMARPDVPAIPTRPLSLTILAWFMLVGSPSFLMILLLRYPAPLLTKVLTGWPAILYYLGCAIVHLYVGIGLLRLNPAARRVGVAYYWFLFVNMAVFHLAPGGRPRMLDLIQKTRSSFQWMQTQPWQSQPTLPYNAAPFLVIGVCFGLAGILVPLYFLVTRKQAYERAAAAVSRDLATSAPN
jgi:hypothetical protein